MSNPLVEAWDRAFSEEDEHPNDKVVPLNADPLSKVVRPLGYANGCYFYYSVEMQQVCRLRTRDHFGGGLLGIANKAFWDTYSAPATARPCGSWRRIC